MPEKLMGEVTHYFDKIGVAVIKATKGPIKVGQKLHFVGKGADFTQEITSMQVDHKNVEELKIGEEGGIKVDETTRKSTEVYLAEE